MPQLSEHSGKRKMSSPSFKFIFILASLNVLLVAKHRASAADMQQPLAVAVAADGTIYIADGKLPGIWKVAGGKRTIYFQADKKFRTPLNAIHCLAIDA